MASFKPLGESFFVEEAVFGESRIDLKISLEFWDIHDIENKDEVDVLFRALPSSQSLGPSYWTKTHEGPLFSQFLETGKGHLWSSLDHHAYRRVSVEDLIRIGIFVYITTHRIIPGTPMFFRGSKWSFLTGPVRINTDVYFISVILPLLTRFMASPYRIWKPDFYPPEHY